MNSRDALGDTSSASAITDSRVIEFTPIALRAAAESVGVAILGLPSGAVVTSVGLRPPVNAVELGYGGVVPERLLCEGELAALLIAYCIAAKIPIPMKAEKRLRVTQTGIAFGFVSSRRLPPLGHRPPR